MNYIACGLFGMALGAILFMLNITYKNWIFWPIIFGGNLGFAYVVHIIGIK